MASRQGSIARRAGLAAGGAALLAVGLLAGTGASDAHAAPCANRDATIDQATAKQFRKALACEINKKRSARDRPRLDKNGKLEKAARRHNKTMLDQDCWAHKCNGEDALEKRIRKSGYLKHARKWKFAENFGCAATPKGMVSAWSDSDFQRRNLLNPKYRDFGVTASKQQVSNPPSNCSPDRVTYTAVFASRKG